MTLTLRRVLVATVATVLLLGCAQLGLQRSTISLNRDETLLFYADLKADVREAIAIGAAACSTRSVPADACARLGPILERFRAADALFQAAVRAKREISLQDLRGLLEVAALVGRFAGVPIPTLPR